MQAPGKSITQEHTKLSEKTLWCRGKNPESKFNQSAIIKYRIQCLRLCPKLELAINLKNIIIPL